MSVQALIPAPARVPPYAQELTGSWIRRMTVHYGLPAQDLLRGILNGSRRVRVTGTPSSGLELFLNAPARAELTRFTGLPLARLTGLLPSLATHELRGEEEVAGAAWRVPRQAWVSACPACTSRACSPGLPVLVYPEAAGHVCRRHQRWLLAHATKPVSIPLQTRAVRVLLQAGARVEALCGPALAQLDSVERGGPVRVPDDGLLAGVREVLVAAVHSAEPDLFRGCAVPGDEHELSRGADREPDLVSTLQAEPSVGVLRSFRAPEHQGRVGGEEDRLAAGLEPPVPGTVLRDAHPDRAERHGDRFVVGGVVAPVHRPHAVVVVPGTLGFGFPWRVTEMLAREVLGHQRQVDLPAVRVCGDVPLEERTRALARCPGHLHGQVEARQLAVVGTDVRRHSRLVYSAQGGKTSPFQAAELVLDGRGGHAVVVRDRVEAGLGSDVLDVGEVRLRRAPAPHPDHVARPNRARWL
nr:TniQ family protein [Streptomyces afghaniensis]